MIFIALGRGGYLKRKKERERREKNINDRDYRDFKYEKIDLDLNKIRWEEFKKSYLLSENIVLIKKDNLISKILKFLRLKK